MRGDNCVRYYIQREGSTMTEQGQARVFANPRTYVRHFGRGEVLAHVYKYTSIYYEVIELMKAVQ